ISDLPDPSIASERAPVLRAGFASPFEHDRPRQPMCLGCACVMAVEASVTTELQVSRRALLRAGGAAMIGMALPPGGSLSAAAGPLERRLVAGPGRVALAGAG